MSGEIITSTEQLRTLCARLESAPWIALDTEFMRVSTYRARLCLVQLATPDLVTCVDPLAALDFEPLLDVLYAPNTIKVLHAARQDLEVLADIRGEPPRPVFDTQLAATLVGYDDQIGYGALVEKITGQKLLKMEARTDWAMRPLTAAQISYAEDDVRYLRDVYLHLSTEVNTAGRTDWLAQECSALTEPALYRNDPADAWRRLGGGANLAPTSQTVLAALAEWREREAQQRDLPRGWVVPDSALVEIARRAPTTAAQLAQIEDLKPAMIRRDAESILKLVEQAQRDAPQTRWEPAERLSAAQMDLLKRLTTHAREKASALKLSAGLLAPRRELMRLMRDDADCTLLRGWRREVIGDELLALLRDRK